MDVVNFIFFLVVLLAWINLDILEDYYYIIFNNNWHNADAAFRVIMSFFLFYQQFGLHYWAAGFALFWLSFYWIYFDIGLNLKRGKNWDYVGSHAYTDKMLNKYFMKTRPIYPKVAAFVFFLALSITLRVFDL